MRQSRDGPRSDQTIASATAERGRWTYSHLAILVFLSIHPFHYIAQQYYELYREGFAFAMAALACGAMLKTTGKAKLIVPALFAIAFVVYLATIALLVSDRPLYGEPPFAALRDSAIDAPSLYVLRNATLYLPLALLASMLRWTERQLVRLAQIVSVTAVVSIFGFLAHKAIIVRPQEIVGVIEYGAAGLAYNSFVPYLTYAYVCALLCATAAVSFAGRLVGLISSISLAVYATASSSRQSALFILVSSGLWALLSRGKTRAFPLALVTFYTFALSWLVAGGELKRASNERLGRRYESLQAFIDTNRGAKVLEGIELLQGTEWIHGAGLGSVIAAGPHNDFVRWVQRAGLPGMIVGIVPFAWAVLATYKRWRAGDRKPYTVFLLIAGLFVFHHSLFGYPRDDAFQAPYVFLTVGLSMSAVRGYNGPTGAGHHPRRSLHVA